MNRHTPSLRSDAGNEERPLVGLLCCNAFVERPVQSVATRFIEPLARVASVDAMLVPALPDLCDVRSIARRLDGLLLTGSRSNVAPHRYGGTADSGEAADERRDEVALALSAALIEAGKPVFGICRGLQELNVLFGGTLRTDLAPVHHHPGSGQVAFDQLFAHRHAIDLAPAGLLAGGLAVEECGEVNSVHTQGIDRLGSGLQVEAVSPEDGVVEAFSGEACGAAVLAVQWHPEWDLARSPVSRRFFELLGQSARTGDGIAAFT